MKTTSWIATLAMAAAVATAPGIAGAAPFSAAGTAPVAAATNGLDAGMMTEVRHRHHRRGDRVAIGIGAGALGFIAGTALTNNAYGYGPSYRYGNSYGYYAPPPPPVYYSPRVYAPAYYDPPPRYYYAPRHHRYPYYPPGY